jgi:hypothetical protein
MTRLGRLLSILRPNFRRLTHSGKSGRPAKGLAALPNVSWINKLFIFRISEAQTLDLLWEFVRIRETNFWPAERLDFAPIELFVARKERVRGRSVANWQ